MVRDRVVVSAERPGTGRQDLAGAAAATSPMLASHAEMIGWLGTVLKGKSEDQCRARIEIAIVLEEQGLVENAEEAYWTNIDAKSTDRRSYDRLLAIYKRRGDKLSASLVQRKLDEM